MAKSSKNLAPTSVTAPGFAASVPGTSVKSPSVAPVGLGNLIAQAQAAAEPKTSKVAKVQKCFINPKAPRISGPYQVTDLGRAALLTIRSGSLRHTKMAEVFSFPNTDAALAGGVESTFILFATRCGYIA